VQVLRKANSVVLGKLSASFSEPSTIYASPIIRERRVTIISGEARRSSETDGYVLIEDITYPEEVSDMCVSAWAVGFAWCEGI
jgi:hypothetical protein